MTTRRLISNLQQLPGLSGIRYWHVDYAIRAGKIAPPALDESLRFDWQPEHIELLAAVLKPRQRSR